MAIDCKHLPEDPNVLRELVLDLVAQLNASESRRIKIEHLLQQLLEAKSGRKSEQLSRDQLELFAADLQARGIGIEEPLANEEGGPGDPPASSDGASEPAG